MTLKSDLSAEVLKILDYQLEVYTSKSKVPTKADLTLGESAALLETAILFTDIRGSSKLTETHRKTTIAKIYNAFLNCALRIVKEHDGEVRSFNGDSLLAFFNPRGKPCENAVASALILKWSLEEIIKPAMRKKRYFDYFDIGIGVCYGEVLCTKVGIRGEDNNDLIWPGTATNLSAKMGNQAKSPYNILINMELWNKLPSNYKFTNSTSSSFLLPPVEVKKPIWIRTMVDFAGEKIPCFKTNYFMEVQ